MSITPKDYRFQRILQKAAAFRTLRQVLFDALPQDKRDNTEQVTLGRDLVPGDK